MSCYESASSSMNQKLSLCGDISFAMVTGVYVVPQNILQVCKWEGYLYSSPASSHLEEGSRLEAQASFGFLFLSLVTLSASSLTSLPKHSLSYVDGCFACMFVYHLCAWCLRRPEFLESQMVVTTMNLGPLEEQPVLVTAQPFLQPCGVHLL